jgi:peptidoglycan hydrolase-like protein with peptidoglycan-binding domain
MPGFDFQSLFNEDPERQLVSGPGATSEWRIKPRSLMDDDSDPRFPAFQQAWQQGAGLGDLFGPEPFKLQGTVAPSGGDNTRADVAKVQTLLGKTGHLDLGSDGPSGYANPNTDRAIRDFQKDNGLQVDGVLKPNGPTISKLSGLLGGDASSQPSDIRRGEWNQQRRESSPWGTGTPEPLGKNGGRRGDLLSILSGETPEPAAWLTTTQPSPGRPNVNFKVASAGLTANDAEAGGGGASSDGNRGNSADSKPADMVSPSGAAARQNVPANQGASTGTGRANGGGVSDVFLDAIYNAEQGGKVGDNRNPAEQGPGTTKGKYQITDETLRSIGWKDAKGKWTSEAEKHGIKSDQDFLKSESAQNTAGKQVFDRKRKALDNFGAFDKAGQNVKGLKAGFSITENGLLAAAHREGEGVVLDYLKHQEKNGWKSNFDNLDPKMRRWDIKDASGKVTRTAEDRFRAIETRIRTFENVK